MTPQTPPTVDTIRPDYYKAGTPYEAYVVAEQYGLDKDAYLFDAFLYIIRAGQKPGAPMADDIRKAITVLTRRLRTLEVTP